MSITPPIYKATMIYNCDAAFDEQAVVNVTQAADVDVKKEGAASASFDIAGAFTTGIIGSKAIASTDMSGATQVRCWVRSTVNVGAGELLLLFDNTANCASPLESLDLGAITANTWVQKTVTLSDPSLLTAVISVGLQLTADLGAQVIYIDRIEMPPGASPLTEYTLQTDRFSAGTMTVKLFSEFSGLTLPSYNSLIYSETGERYDSIPGSIEIDEMTCEFLEDYTNYFEGFWYKVLSGYCQIQFYLTNDEGVSEHFFWGRAAGPVSELEELAIVGGNYFRVGKFQLVSVLSALRDVSIGDLVDDCQNYLDTRTGVTYSYTEGGAMVLDFITVRAFMASALVLAFGQTHDEADIVSNVEDIDFYDILSASIDFNDIYMFAKVTAGVMNDGTSFYWDGLGKNAFEAISKVADSLFLIPRHAYDVSTGRHKIQLLTRGRSGTAGTYDVPLESRLIVEAYPKLLAFTSYCVYSTTPANVRSLRIEGTEQNTELGDLSDEDVTTIDHAFILRENEMAFNGSPGGNYKAFLYSTDNRIGDCQFYDYNLASTVDEDFIHVRYFSGRFSFSKMAYEVTYPQVLIDGSLDNNRILMVNNISDGLTTRAFYAVEVRKNVFENETTVLWHER